MIAVPWSQLMPEMALHKSWHKQDLSSTRLLVNWTAIQIWKSLQVLTVLSCILQYNHDIVAVISTVLCIHNLHGAGTYNIISWLTPEFSDSTFSYSGLQVKNSLPVYIRQVGAISNFMKQSKPYRLREMFSVYWHHLSLCLITVMHPWPIATFNAMQLSFWLW